MSAEILIPAMSGALDSEEFSLIGNNPISLSCIGLTGTEVVKIKIWDEVTKAYVDYIIAGVLQKFDINNIAVEIWDSAFRYIVSKPITTNAIGVSKNTII